MPVRCEKDIRVRDKDRGMKLLINVKLTARRYKPVGTKKITILTGQQKGALLK
jgi:hypothetical protein